jgi:hypothetical protein
MVPIDFDVRIPALTPANGSTEVWLGTHTNSGLHIQEGCDGQITANYLETRRKISPPIQPVIPKESIIIRDLRLWRCGKPNHEGTIRVMLAMIHFASWYRNSMRSLPFVGFLMTRLKFPLEWKDEDIPEHKGLEIVWDPRYTEIKYLDHGNTYFFDQENRLNSDEHKALSSV